ncbi:hypothetical protein JW721_03655 [Candidatus Micrarchaeota archaeon]|nr:hypothetical protein [Candidatus Micrarchaeota archaeon]
MRNLRHINTGIRGEGNPASAQRRAAVFRRQHEGNSSPSIGAAGIRLDSANGRVKGIIPRLITRTRELVGILDSAREMARENGADRATLRFFLPSFGSLEQSGEGRELASFIRNFSGTANGYVNVVEGVLPFACEAGEMMMVYLAMNEPSRISPKDVLLHEQGLRRIAETGLHAPVENGDYAIRSAQMGDVPSLVELYSVFTQYLISLNEENVARMVESTPVLVATSSSSGKVVSALAAEHVAIEVEGAGTVHLIELSEAATSPEHRGKNLCSIMARIFLENVDADLGRLGVIAYAEARAAHPAPTRTFLQAGGEIAGCLNKHCVLESERMSAEQGDFENLNVVQFR